MDMMVRSNEGAAFMSTPNEAVAISDFISQLDEAAAKRLQRMNQRLRELEMQMELLENEICKSTDDPSFIDGFQA